ncbi:MAG: hypothetical protein ACK5M3_15230 [Dysgonomonas sp.]
MKTVYKILLIGLFVFIPFVFNISLDDFFMYTIYAVSGIMFSIGLGMVVTFNLQGTKNKTFISKIRQNLNTVRNSYIRYFAISTVCFILEKYLRQADLSVLKIPLGENFILSFNASVFLFLVMLYSILYFIINFLALQKLNNDLFDKLNE